MTGATMSQYQYQNHIKPSAHPGQSDTSNLGNSSGSYAVDSSFRGLNTTSETQSNVGSVLLQAGTPLNLPPNTHSVSTAPILSQPAPGVIPLQGGQNLKNPSIGSQSISNPSSATLVSTGSSITSSQTNPYQPSLPLVYKKPGDIIDTKEAASINSNSTDMANTVSDLQQLLQVYGYQQTGPYNVHQKPIAHQLSQQGQSSFKDLHSPSLQIATTTPIQPSETIQRQATLATIDQPEMAWNNSDNYNQTYMEPNSNIAQRPGGGQFLPNRHYSLPQTNVGSAYIAGGQAPGSAFTSSTYTTSGRPYTVGGAASGFNYEHNKPSYYYDATSVNQNQQQQYYNYHTPSTDSENYQVHQSLLHRQVPQQPTLELNLSSQGVPQQAVSQSPKALQGYTDFKYNVYQGSNASNTYGNYYSENQDRNKVANSLLYNMSGEPSTLQYPLQPEYDTSAQSSSMVYNAQYPISMLYPNQDYINHGSHPREPMSPKRFKPRKHIDGKQMPMSRASNSVSLLVQEWFVIEPSIEQREKMFSNKWRLGTTETSYFNKRKRAIGVIHNVEKQFPNLDKFQIAKYIDDYLKVKKFKYPQFISHIQTVVQRQQCEREILDYIRNELDKA